MNVTKKQLIYVESDSDDGFKLEETTWGTINIKSKSRTVAYNLQLDSRGQVVELINVLNSYLFEAEK